MRFRPKCIDVAIIGSDYDLSVRHRCRARQGLTDFVLPKFFAILQVDEVKPPIIRADHNLAITNHRRAIHLSSRAKRPNGLSILTINTMKSFVSPPEHYSVRCQSG